MGKRELAKRRFQNLIQTKQDRAERQRGILGNGAGVVRVTDRPDLVYIRINADSARVWEVINDQVSDTNDLPVIIERLPGSVWQVIGIDRGMLASVGSGWQGKQFARTHGPEHEWPDYKPGPDAVSVRPRNMYPLRTDPLLTYSLSVQIRPYRYTYENTFKDYAGEILDLSGFVPGSGIRQVLTYLDVRHNASYAIPGAPVTYTATASPPAPIAPWYAEPSGLITLHQNQNIITESDITDPRALYNEVGLLHRLQGERNPTTADNAAIGFAEGSMWINRLTGTVFVCVNPVIGGAVWRQVSREENVTFTFSNYTVQDTDGVILGDASGGDITISLPTVTYNITGRKYSVKKIDSSVNSVIVDPFETERVDNALTYSLASQNDSIRVVAYNIGWYILSSNL